MQLSLIRLDPILNPYGFHFHPEHNAISSGGAFSNGFYKCGKFQIGIIMMGNTLGLPNYDYEKYHSGHIGLIEQLGHNKDSVLRFDKKRWKLITVDGQDVLDAFVADLQNIILPAISNDLAKYQQAINNAHNERMKRMR